MTQGAIPSTRDGLEREEQEILRMEAELKQRRTLVKRAREQLESMTPTHKLACVLHDRLCRWNHTDGCAWHYAIKNGVHDWSEHSHREYLRQATQAMQRLGNGVITQENVADFLSDVLK